MVYDQLSFTGAKIRNVNWHAERLRVDFGGGYGASALVGHTAGLHRWKLQMSFMPTSLTNAGTISSKNWFDYYYDFFIAHTTGAEETFLMWWTGTDPPNPRNWHVKFAESEIDFERFKGDIYGSGVELVQVRVEGVTYLSDGAYET